MLLDASIAADNTFAGTLETTCSAPSRGVSDWQSVDRALRAIARRKAALDAEEARWLREAEALQIWRQLGMVSALDYMERVLGYGPRAGQDRLRVARALGTLPRLTDALAAGALSFSAVREVTRVATPTTEQAWRDAAVGKNLRQIEELVADHQPGTGRTIRRARRCGPAWSASSSRRRRLRGCDRRIKCSMRNMEAACLTTS